MVSGLIPVPKPVTDTSKAAETKAVFKWLNDNGYQIEQLSPGYRLTHKNGSSTVSNSVNGILGTGDVIITI